MRLGILTGICGPHRLVAEAAQRDRWPSTQPGWSQSAFEWYFRKKGQTPVELLLQHDTFLGTALRVISLGSQYHIGLFHR